ncbi:prepilin peptidase [Saccharopolyspora rhizosphaerae]|uniref:Prepilin peptidase n=1 Tax=Saccharopolyspora rhizosphaerae TaxID=2492662 RepID=A0A426JYH7_9PSEU|nr:A24 family peptidase [Saccharopolyspora rhizosphaerae]RRO18198.1 prepilin peptidase [Saccharopolyspora rhizosphaerae]
MSAVVMAVVGALAGWGGRRWLGRLPRGTAVPGGWCEVGVGLAWAVVGLREVPWWWAPVPMLVAWGGVLLGACDLRVHRLPDALTVPGHLVLAVLLGFAALHRPGVVLGAVAGFVLFCGTYLVVRLIAPAAMGAGDVKLAGGLGMAVGAVSVPAVVLVMVSAALFTLVGALSQRTRAVAHGPAVLAPAWLVTLSWP